MAKPCRFVGFIFRCLVYYLWFISSYISCEKVVLLDSTKTSRLGWTTQRNGPTDQSNYGWREGSYTKDGSPIRVYASCSVSSNGVDNWLRTPFIDRDKANSISVEIEFSMRKCSRHSDPSSLTACKETFHLYYYEADSDIANELMPSWDATTYTKVDVIAADYLYEGKQGEEIKLNFDKQEIALNKGLGGVYLAFQDTGACVSLISIKVYYIKCPNITMNYAFFLETPTGSSPQALEEREGVCIANSQMESKATLLCRSSGQWYYNSGNCQCIAGYEGNNGTECLACKVGYYKSSAGNQKCYRCPDHSYTNVPQSVQCTCDSGYYRSPTDKKDMQCTQPPSAPTHLRVTDKTNNRLTLIWNRPVYDGDRADLFYKVICYNCDHNVVFVPSDELNSTSVTLQGLRSSTEYNITVFAHNGVTVTSKQKPQSDSIKARTDYSLAVIDNLKIVQKLSSGTVVITWELAQHVKEEVELYEVKWYPSGFPNLVLSNETTFTNYTFHNLDLAKVYNVQIRGKTTNKGWGDYSDPLQIKDGDNQLEKVELEQPMPSVGIIVGSIIAVFLCMSIAAIMIIILLKRNRPQCSETKGGDCDTLHYGHGEVVHCPPLEPHMNGGLTMPLFTPPGSVKTYVDPHTYEDPNQAVREFTKEIDSSHIVIESVIGGGEFGDVCKGKLRIPRRMEMSVAIKTLKQGATDKDRMEFLTEASIMGQFDDPNVIYLEGVVTKNFVFADHPIMIVTEYMLNGSLDTFLRNNDGKFTVIQLVGMMRGIASGMSYLSEMGYVHRDLAARNILIGENLVCKVADFGLSREIDLDTTDGAYTTKGGKIPVRWTAPEAIAFRKFTSASDVWSYGVVMWEIISYGERPYWNWSNQYVIQAVERGFRLPPPMDCPEAIHQLMLDCWQKERGNRPKMTQVVRSHDKFIRAPELLKKIAKPRADLLMDLNPVNEVSRFNNVEGWLISIKMDRYIQNFLNAGYRTMEQVSTITSRDLETLGVTLIGHQKKIMNSIQTLRTQLYGPHFQVSEGFLV
ncbi:ephrin type-B receptor 1-B-like isoform X4 [Mytilus californianus]|uniref:ephrin type-B receptor 1-B-like isoform X4 n=1 Tax=Mytilus californianus TaxID=6549 RepID=UPI002248320E|nr:ephrin type-B receptor 1-B-like isoform X4 [Mytilus californianus]